MLFAGICALAACSDDRDDNPTIKQPDTFSMQTPSFGGSQLNLKDTANLAFTWDKPDFGYRAKVDYTIEVSHTGNFTTSYADEDAGTVAAGSADYKEIQTVYVTNAAQLTNFDLALALQQVAHWKESTIPTTAQAVYMRVKAVLPGIDTVYSNTIQFAAIPTYVKVAPKINSCYLTGSGYGWSKWKSLTPVKGTVGLDATGTPTFWAVIYFAADEQFKCAPQAAWGNDFGYAGTTITDNAGANVSDEGGNIKVGTAGWYVLVVSNDGEKRTISFEQPKVYLQGPTIGNWDCKPENLFTVPTTASGNFVSPAFVASDFVRMCVKLNGFDWSRTEFVVDANGAISYRGNGVEQSNVAVSVGKRCYLNFSTGKGEYK